MRHKRVAGLGLPDEIPHIPGMTDPPLRLAVFDCDGTLVDSQHAIVTAMAVAMRSRNLPEPHSDEVRRVVGLPLEAAIARLTPDQPEAEHRRLASVYRSAFLEAHRRGDSPERLYPGAREALEALDMAGVLLGIATGKGRSGLEATLRRHDLAGRFVTVQTSDRAAGKPAPDMLLRAMEETGVDRSCTVMVGDTVYDMEMARNAGVAAVGVSWGYHPSDELRAAGAMVVVDAFDEVLAHVATIAEPQ
ncbi:MAG: HAD-IA family hydrolase [Alphaproteobacteria bacterium]